jgi:eukaryotic-like serine/threonine-protein kinase
MANDQRQAAGSDGAEAGTRFAAGTVLDDKFRIERLLGMGGMGAVYEITHVLTKHRRAMKLLHPQFAQQKTVVERFFREASAAAHIGNDHIIETFDAGWLAGGEPYLVMELLDGMPLADRIEVLPEGMDLGESAEIFEQLCDGVQAAHDAGIVHRDLKPDNVFLARSSGKWLVKVLDFGVSKFDEKLATKLTSGGSMVGTPAYMSPEQFDRGADVDPPSDVYALGVLLYEMITGVHPYPADTMAQLVKMILTSSPVPITKLRPDLPADLQALLEHMLEVDPEERIASPREVAKRLTAIAGASPGEIGLHSTALSDPTELGSGTKPSDGSLAFDATVAPSTDQESVPAAPMFTESLPAPSVPAASVPAVSLPAATLATTQVIEDEPESRPESAAAAKGRGWLVGLVGLGAIGTLVAVTQLGESDPSGGTAASANTSAPSVTASANPALTPSSAALEPPSLAPSASASASAPNPIGGPHTPPATQSPPSGTKPPSSAKPPPPPPPATTPSGDRAGLDELPP